MKTRRQRRRPGWRQRLRNRCAYRAALVRLIKVGTRRVATERNSENAFVALACKGKGVSWGAFLVVQYGRIRRIPTCGECGADYPEQPCGNPCNVCQF